MSILSLFSSSGNRNNDIPSDVRTGFMGKIPARPDFVRYQAGSQEIKLLDQWIHEGIAYLARRFPLDWKERLEGFAHIHCYIGGEGSNPTLCGVICASHDKSGRQHPFVDFATCSNAQAMQSLPYISYRFADFYAHGGKLKNQDGSDLDIDSLTQQSNTLIRSIPRYVEANYSQQRNESWVGKSSAEFWSAILPSANANTRLNFARDVLQTLKMASNRGPERISWGVRLPIPSGAASDAIVSFWMSLFIGVLGNQKWRPYVFWNPQSKTVSSLTVYFRSPNASSFAQLISPESDEGGVVDVVLRPLENLAGITSTHLKNLVEKESLTWLEMLDNWVRG
jgi:type VI secretion system protein ImpM